MNTARARRYGANVSMLFTDLPFLHRFEAARAAGFEGVEFLWPTAEQLEGRQIAELGTLIRSTGLRVELFNLDAGDMAAGWRGLVGVADARGQFKANLPVAIELARQLGCRKLNALAGNATSDGSRASQLGVLAEGLAIAADAAAPAGISIMLEALNPVEFSDYLVRDSATALEVLDRVARPNVRFQLDVYHLAMGGEDPAAVVRKAGDKIGHVQFADVPGRHEPGTGGLDWPEILRALDDVGYDDWIGLEYRPSEPGSREFGFVEAIGGRLQAASASAD